MKELQVWTITDILFHIQDRQQISQSSKILEKLHCNTESDQTLQWENIYQQSTYAFEYN